MKVIRVGDRVLIEEGERREVVLEDIGYNRRRVVLIRPGEVFYDALFEHYVRGTAGKPITPAIFEAVFMHKIEGVASAPITSVPFAANFAHAVVGVAGLPAQPITFEVAFTHRVAGVAGVPNGLVTFEAAFSQVVAGVAGLPQQSKFFEAEFSHFVSGVAGAPDFAKFFSVAFNHLVVGEVAPPNFSKIFNADFIHFTQGVAGQPVGPVPGVDPDYQAVLNFATSQGYTLPSAPVQDAQNTLMVALKSAGIFTKVDRLYIFASDGNADFAGINWVNPATSTNALRVNSPTFQTNQGFKGDGVSAYLNIQLNDLATASKYVANSGHIAAYRYNLGTQIGNTFGAITSGFAVEAIFTGQTAPAAVNRSNIQSTGVNAPAGAVTDGLGFVAITRGNVSQVTTRKGGVSTLRTSTGRGSVQPTTASYILARGLGTVGAQDFSDEGLGVFSLGGDITAELVDYETAINAYLAAI
jgi:hypothetical protein